MDNSYIQQLMAQTGMTYLEAARSVARRPVTLAYAQSQGFSSVDDYEQELHEFLNSN